MDHDPNIDPDYNEELDEDYSNRDDDTAHTEPETDVELQNEDGWSMDGWSMCASTGSRGARMRDFHTLDHNFKCLQVKHPFFV